MSDPIRCHVRWMTRRDLPEVLAAEAHGTPDPWDEDRLLGLLGLRHVVGLVAEVGLGEIAGHVLYRLKPRSLEVERLVVAPRHRRRGVGTKLVAKLMGKLDPRRRSALLLPVPETCEDFHLFLRALGVPAITVERNDVGPDDYLFVANCEADEPRVAKYECEDNVP